MMWISSLLLLVAFSSVLGQFEDIGAELEQCGKEIQELDVERLQEQSGDEQMEAVCPKILEAFHCVDGIFAREFESTFEEFADLFIEFIGGDIGKILRVSVNTKSLLTDLCTDGTQLNKDVKADMECFESIDENEAADECKAKASIYGVFTDISNEIEEVDSDFDPDAVCQEAAFMAACISYLVHDKCGQRAFKTFNTIIKRTTIFPNMICSIEKLEDLKTTLVERLDMPEAEKNIFKLGLDLKRRRK